MNWEGRRGKQSGDAVKRKKASREGAPGLKTPSEKSKAEGAGERADGRVDLKKGGGIHAIP